MPAAAFFVLFLICFYCFFLQGRGWPIAIAIAKIAKKWTVTAKMADEPL